MSVESIDAIGPGDFVVKVDQGARTVTIVDSGTVIRKRFLCDVTATGAGVDIRTDPGGLYAIFGDRRAGVFSSSLRAVLTAGQRRYPVNRDALCEQLVAGAITGRETAFEGIERVDGLGQCDAGGVAVSLRRGACDTDSLPTRFRSAAACIDFQIEVLRAYFRSVAELASARGVSMGLSGGYDSRLMLVLARHAGIPVHPYTYESLGHKRETTVAGQLAEHAGLELRRVAVRSQDDLDSSALDANVDDALSYFDGRTNRSMGTFGDVHTARVHRQCVEPATVNLNGMGGELYRNRERLPLYQFGFRDWFWHLVTRPMAHTFFISNQESRAFERHLARKYGELLGMDSLSRMDRTIARRWYRDVWLPYFAGPRLSAENRVAPSLMPFADARVSTAGLSATPFIGSHGEFEAAMIRKIDESLAALSSSYGPGFGRSSRAARVRDDMMGIVPPAVRLRRHRLLMRLRRRGTRNARKWQERFNESISFLKKIKLPLDIDRMLCHEDERYRILYVAEFLFRFRDHIELDH